MIKSYFDKVRGKIKEISPLVKCESISFDMGSPEMGIIKGRIVFFDGSIFFCVNVNLLDKNQEIKRGI